MSRKCGTIKLDGSAGEGGGQILRTALVLAMIGSAGSCTLVLQTLVLVLLHAEGPSTIRVTGGTHNDMAPPVQFLQRAYRPLLEAMGASVDFSSARACDGSLRRLWRQDGEGGSGRRTGVVWFSVLAECRENLL